MHWHPIPAEVPESVDLGPPNFPAPAAYPVPGPDC